MLYGHLVSNPGVPSGTPHFGWKALPAFFSGTCRGHKPRAGQGGGVPPMHPDSASDRGGE